MESTKGLVLRSTGSWYDVYTDDGRNIQCRLKGKMRLDQSAATNPVAVGDRVLVTFLEEEGSFVIAEIEARRNYIVRESPKNRFAKHIVAANIDQAFLVVTISSPRTSTGFIDRFLMTAEAYHIPVSIILNKQDLYREKELNKQEMYVEIYEQLGYPLHLISATNSKDTKSLQKLIKGKTTLFSGHSGAGKSTLINALVPGLEQRVGEISAKHDKGIHTTTFAEMFPIPEGGYIIDTPGIKEFGILDFEPHEIGHYFVDIRKHMSGCRFNNCMHEEEPGCAVKEAMEAGDIHVERYANYLNILGDYKANYKHWERK